MKHALVLILVNVRSRFTVGAVFREDEKMIDNIGISVKVCAL